MNEKRNPMQKIAALIVDKRKAFYLLYIGLAIFSVFSTGWTQVNDDITTYLPEETETRQGLDIMEREFITFGTSRVMVDNISYDKAKELSEQISDIDGVKSVEFDETSDHYANGAALFSITYDGTAADDVSLRALEQIQQALNGYDLYLSGDTGDSTSESLDSEMQLVFVIAAAIILLVLLFTSHTYMEIPVLLLTFGLAAVLNMGSNFLLGTISFVSNSIAVVLQLALAIDYAIILCHRYTEERLVSEPREAVITALSKAIPEISGSSLTTLSGLAAMMCMQFKIGYDMGLVMIKAILLSLLSVFTLMPGLLLSFSSLIDRTHHKSFVPKITQWGRLTVKTRYLVPPIFVALLIGGFLLSNRCPFVYGYSALTTANKNEAQLAQEKIESVFGKTNTLAVLVPVGDYEKEGQLLRELAQLPQVDSALGLANVEAVDGYVLTDALTPRQFAELTDLDIEVARLLYSAYAVDQQSYGRLAGNLDQYGVALIDMFLFVYDRVQEGYVTLDTDTMQTLEDLHLQLTDAQKQLKGQTYSRMVLELNLPEESPETFAFLDTVHAIAGKYYDSGVYLSGNSTSDRDLASSFAFDNIIISILSAVFVILVLVFTFQSAGLPILLILVIQGSIWINFSFPTLTGSNLFFLSYLIVSAIQMGANIDYAIVITNRYTQLKQTLSPKQAIVETLNQAFPTIITSGSILVAAGILIGRLSSDPAVSSIGSCLGRGTIISIFLVMGVLPQILLLGDIIIEKTAFTLKRRGSAALHTGMIRVSGHVRGYVEGMMDADLNGTLVGTIRATVEAGSVTAADPLPSEDAAGAQGDSADGPDLQKTPKEEGCTL